MTSRMSVPTLLLILCSGFGCDQGPKFYEVVGSVTCDGVPIDDGEIIFIANDDSSTPAGARIQNGTYQLKIPAGKKKVRIAASRKIPGKGAMGEDYVLQSYIPPRYNDQTTLEAEVAAKSINQFNFALDSKPKAGN